MRVQLHFARILPPENWDVFWYFAHDIWHDVLFHKSILGKNRRMLYLLHWEDINTYKTIMAGVYLSINLNLKSTVGNPWLWIVLFYLLLFAEVAFVNLSCGSYYDFFDRGLLLTRKLLNQGFLVVKLKSSLRKFYCCHHDLVNRYRIYVSQIIMDMFRPFHHWFVITGFITRVTWRVPLEKQKLFTPRSSSRLLVGFELLNLSFFCLLLYRSLCGLLFLFLPLYCLSFFYLQLLITLLVSSNLSYFIKYCAILNEMISVET
jgi:hypothetical protein